MLISAFFKLFYAERDFLNPWLLNYVLTILDGDSFVTVQDGDFIVF
jgi:hypothetical protein